MSKVTIIIPVYKVEQYIERCAQSLFEQTLDDIEYLFIDDCSPDNAVSLLEQVIEQYPKRKKRVRIIRHTKNQGISATRKEGILEATGEYIGWCDSDDWCEPTMYEQLWLATEGGKRDIAMCDYDVECADATQHVHLTRHDNSKEYLANGYRNAEVVSTLWNKLFRRDCLLGAAVSMPTTQYAEDLYLVSWAFSHADSIGYSSQPLYHYNKTNIGSLMHNDKKTMDNWKKVKQCIDSIDSFLKETGDDQFILFRSFIKFQSKNNYRECFTSVHAYYETYKETHCYIRYYKGMNWKVALIHTNYLFLLFGSMLTNCSYYLHKACSGKD